MNIRENQGWTQPTGVKGAQLLNLYQRQCLTVDRDAPLGLRQEIWSTTLSSGNLVVMLMNKGKLPAHMAVSWELLGLEVPKGEAHKIVMTDLWTHEEVRVQPLMQEVGAVVAPHGVVVLQISTNSE